MVKNKIPLNPLLKKGQELKEIKDKAENLLVLLSNRNLHIADLEKQANIEMEKIKANYEGLLTKQYDDKTKLEKELIKLMKKNKAILFTSGDVVNLPPGSLIRNAGQKVVIPRTALQACKDNGFEDVIKKVESLDREAIEKWTDTKLVLIGAERKPSEEFKYDLKLREN